MEDTVLIHIWDILKAYIPKKELPTAAEQLVTYLEGDDIVSTSELNELGGSCPIIAEVLANLYDDVEEFDDEDDW